MIDAPSLAIVSALPMPVMLVARTERIVAMNGAAVRLVGRDGTGWHYITALRQPAILDAVEQTLRDGGTRVSRYLASERDRDTYWNATVGPVDLHTDTGVGRGALLSFEDVTAVEQSGQMRRDFVANVSHELRTPLTAFIGFVETLRGAARDDPRARDRFLGIMEREAARMARLVDDLLNLSRVEQHERVRPRDRVDLGTIIDQVVAVMGPVAAETGVLLAVTRPEEGPTVPGDAPQLIQVLTNLVENAVKYGGGHREVAIALTGPADEPGLRLRGVRLSVTDHGDGIAAHQIPRLTERFYRIDTHRSRDLGGTGLGLAIVKHIVNRHRGRLRIDSTLGHGSTFTVILPCD